MRRKIFSIFILMGTVMTLMHGQSYYRTTSGSKLWLDGSSTINTFSCTTYRINGLASFNNDSAFVFVRIDVLSLDCGNNKMNDDMFRAMKVEQYPSIQYTMLSADSVYINSANKKVQVCTTGNITIAGVTQKVTIPITITPIDKTHYRVTGRKDLSMHQFNIIPPTAFLGLIRAHDKLIVNFDIVVEKNAGVRPEFVSEFPHH